MELKEVLCYFLGSIDEEMDKMNTLSKEKTFDYDSKELLGVMRFDFYDGRLSNQWNPRELIIEMNDRKLIDLKKLQQELNYIQFTLIKEFNKVVELCNGTGYDKETLVYIELEEGKYVIKLIPVKDSYSYIYTYKRQEEKVMDIITVIKVVGTILTVVASSVEATSKK